MTLGTRPAGNPPASGAGDVEIREDGFAAALDHRPGRHWLLHSDGRRSPLPVGRWHGPPEPASRAVVARCAGPTLDVGCGPGRLTLALTRAGHTAVGVDVSAQAVRLTRRRGAVAVHRDVFAPLPGEGRWAHVLLMDGNIGIGGDPVALLGRCRELVRPGGTVIVELEPPGLGLWRGRSSLASLSADGEMRRGGAFNWARLDAVAVHEVAAVAGMVVPEVFRAGRRWFGELAVPVRPGAPSGRAGR
ncbi:MULTISPECIES: bifunctional 2-polyprenyl-6-hydroxyphenol methylase/3-demethylubiquinol 3-O-methyltransferase UbiG [Micromonospora]|uniref:SAM-dependent methyltransferase n=1 Tax=Micromonospora sicca TaxID=2202420 RepID=A0A317DPW9_9ACTN|nr:MULTISPECIES: class I SAM-dependent methyltransferase [unclassified Micromonospora]MBM0225147.1 class I SAM-dependent methyltransferase [Micromonospora sp. ATA51]PWR16422.1 SAM-dependent methyltransferase [Micromonospora sp. 4G51]